MNIKWTLWGKKERKHQLCTLEIKNPSTTGPWNKQFPSRESHIQVTTLGKRKISVSHKNSDVNLRGGGAGQAKEPSRSAVRSS